MSARGEKREQVAHALFVNEAVGERPCSVNRVVVAAADACPRDVAGVDELVGRSGAQRVR